MGKDDGKAERKHRPIPVPAFVSTIAFTSSAKKRKESPNKVGDPDEGDRHERLALKTMSRLEKTTDPAKRQALEGKLSRLMTALGQDAARAAAAAAPAKKQKAATGATNGATNGAGGSGWGASKPAAGSLSVKGKHSVSLLAAGERAKRQQRSQRFAGELGELEEQEEDEDELVRQAGVGTCESLEKEYLRLTSLPRASSVRPPQILKMALDLVKARWLQKADYAHACEQLKSIRQDLTVQHVRNRLTVDAYETHGRIALEVGDLAEFRQCHGVLKQLFIEGVGGNREEFIAYGLLFALSTSQGTMLVSELMATTAQRDLTHPCVSHALAVCRAVKQGDYHSFAALHRRAPRMSPYLMDRLLPRMRAWALQAMLTAYRPSPLPLSVLEEELAVEQDGADVVALVRGAGGQVDLRTRVVDTRAQQPTGSVNRR